MRATRSGAIKKERRGFDDDAGLTSFAGFDWGLWLCGHGLEVVVFSNECSELEARAKDICRNMNPTWPTSSKSWVSEALRLGSLEVTSNLDSRVSERQLGDPGLWFS